MHILITGAGGFLGQKLVQSLITREFLVVNGKQRKITEIVLFDQSWPDHPVHHPKLETFTGDIRSNSMLAELLKPEPELIFHLAAIVSGQAEQNFNLGMQVNLHANLKLLDIVRNFKNPPIFVFASSCAAFGGKITKRILDDTAPTPLTSYGTQKVMTELLLNDYSRKRWIDARILRLPTIAIRPGKPNAAASSFASSILREPLTGHKVTCPVSPETAVWILSPGKVIYNFIHAAALEGDQIGENRIVNLPGITLKVHEMVEAMRKIKGDHLGDFIQWKPNPFIQSIVKTWPAYFQTQRAETLGFIRNNSIDEIIREFVEDEIKRKITYSNPNSQNISII